MKRRKFLKNTISATLAIVAIPTLIPDLVPNVLAARETSIEEWLLATGRGSLQSGLYAEVSSSISTLPQ